MVLKYKTINKTKPGDQLGEQEFPSHQVVIESITDPEAFINKLVQHAHMSKPDIIRCLYSFRKLLIEEMVNGNILQTGIFGTFSPSLKKSKKEDTKGQIEISINYLPTLEVKKELKQTELKKVGKKGK